MRRLRDLIADAVSDLGGYEQISSAVDLIHSASMLCLQTEMMEQQWAQNDGEANSKQVETYQRITDTLRRTLESLGLHRRARDVTPPNPLDYAQRYDEAEDAEEIAGVNILQAISDPAIFAPAFRDTRSWQAWFVFLAALFGLPLKPEQLAIYQQCTKRTEPRTKPSHEAWLVIGRRGGKSFVLALIAVFLSCFRDWRPYLNVGESGTIMIVAADRRQARTIMRYVKGLLSMVPMLSQLIESETRKSITLTNRIEIEVHSSSFRAVRGYTVVACLADEIACWVTDEGGANPDFEVLNAVRPAMSTIPNSLLLAASSPYARRGTLWETYHKHFGHDAPRLVWQAATRVINPTVPQRLVDEALEADPSAAAAEYLAQFRTDVQSFISREAVERCVNPGALEHPPLLNHQYLAFVDPSGGSNDAMTLAIAHKDADEVAVNVIRERRPPVQSRRR